MARKKKEESLETPALDTKVLDEAWEQQVVQDKPEFVPEVPEENADEELPNEEEENAEEVPEEEEPGEGEEEEESSEEEEESESEEEDEEEPTDQPEEKEAPLPEDKVGTVITYKANKKDKTFKLESKLTERDQKALRDQLSRIDGLDDRYLTSREESRQTREDYNKLYETHVEFVQAVQIQDLADSKIKPFLDAVRYDPNIRASMALTDSVKPVLTAYGWKGDDTSGFDYKAAYEGLTAQNKFEKDYQKQFGLRTKTFHEEFKKEKNLTEEQLAAIWTEAKATGLLVYQADPATGSVLPVEKQIEHYGRVFNSAYGTLLGKGLIKVGTKKSDGKPGDQPQKTAAEREAERLRKKHAPHRSAPGPGGKGAPSSRSDHPKIRKGEDAVAYLTRRAESDPEMIKAAKGVFK
jgi:hypothetical protein